MERIRSGWATPQLEMECPPPLALSQLSPPQLAVCTGCRRLSVAAAPLPRATGHGPPCGNPPGPQGASCPVTSTDPPRPLGHSPEPMLWRCRGDHLALDLSGIGLALQLPSPQLQSILEFGKPGIVHLKVVTVIAHFISHYNYSLLLPCRPGSRSTDSHNTMGNFSCHQQFAAANVRRPGWELE